MKYLLDTHTLVWLVTNTERLSLKVKKIFEDPGSQIFVSAISFWEVSLKFALGKLELVGESFRQIEMERLREIDPGSDLDNMVFSMVRRIEENEPPDPQRKGPQSKNYMSFYKTLKEVMTLGKKLKFQNDIIDFNHSNVMQRNGVPVIMDPWVK